MRLLPVVLIAVLVAIPVRTACASGSSPSTSATPVSWIIPPEGSIHIFIPLRADKEETAAAYELAEALNQISGRRCRVLQAPYLFGRNGIYVGRTALAKELLPDIVALPPLETVPETNHGVAISRFAPLPPERWDNIGWAAQGGRVAIAGSDTKATRLAVQAFLQRVCGVRHWFPGPLGSEYPRQESISLQEGERKVLRPSFVSRDISGLRTSEEQAWKRQNLLRGHISMSHNLPQLFTKEVAEAHPEWFPAFNGKPFTLSGWRDPIPHPLFTSEAAADFVAKRAIEFFDEHPAASSFSLSPADTSLFGDIDNYVGLLDPNAVFRGKSDLSKAVFTFDNRVARKVARVYPNRLLGALAYSFYENVPTFPVEPNLVPFLSADRSQWYDPGFREEDLSLVHAWDGKQTRLLGTWDYLYGQPFLIPRVRLSVQKSSIPALNAAGVNAYYGELYPIWGFDAPKAWITAQLLWDANQDPEVLQDEFFNGCFGPAADVMQRFFERCDDIWMNQEGKARWIRYYKDADEAVLFSPEQIKELREILKETRTDVLPSPYGERVNLVSNAFRYAEREHQAWTSWLRVAQWQPDESLDQLITAVPAFLTGREDMESLNRDCVGDGLNQLDQALPHLVRDDPLPGRLALLQPRLTPKQRSELQRLLPENYLPLLRYQSIPLLRKVFEPGMKGWKVSHWLNPLLDWDVSRAGDDDAGLRVKDANIFAAQRAIRVRPGVVYGLWLEASGQVDPSSDARLVLHYLSRDGQELAVSSDRLPPGQLEGSLLAVAAQAPEQAAWAVIELIVRKQQPGDQLTLRAYVGAATLKGAALR